MELSYEPTQASIPGGGQGDSGERSDSSAGASPSQPPSSMGIWGSLSGFSAFDAVLKRKFEVGSSDFNRNHANGL